ncbi:MULTISPECIES: ATPase domain-containing protein [unclassified Massilia]|uniref:ATPase domain-containing protein n=1 Tax=unclassified Massilia TaxID=2609279 RepID=UPI001780F07F|nr:MULTISPECIES: ATPase domain-containing protein [unclassified Massilia]MBD8530188.1 protein kinase [Massilia sp. CFBP 13647]MBD8673983.1 protein kinase [Massilia sp. CFBP 13721]
MSDKVALGLLQTGVPGLDILLGGGLPEFSFNLVAGPPGSGKTTLAHQIMFTLATPERRALFFTVLGEPPLKMLRYQQQFSFFDVSKVGPAIRYVNLGESLRTGDFSGVLERIMLEVETFSPALVFVDSFRSVVQTAKAGNEGVADLQYFIQELGTRMTSWQATTFLIGEYLNSDPEANPIMTVADGMLSLTQVHEHNTVVRKMRVMKMRGRAHLSGSHNFRITDDGLRAYPRILPPLAPDLQPGVDIDRDPRRISTGVTGLDALMHGGIPQGHTMLVVGPTGSGKTIIATRFLQEGERLGEKGVAVYFEKGTPRLRNAELAEMVQSGAVSVVESRLLDLTVDELIDDLGATLRRTGAKRLVIDSLSELTLYMAPEFHADLRLAVFRLLTVVAKHGVSAMVTIGTDDSFTELSFGQANISYLCDAVLALRYAEVDGRIEKFMSVVKVRGSSHSTDLRSYRITDAGLEVDELPTEVGGVLGGGAARNLAPS